MPLFGGSRDRAFIRRINRELLKRIIGVEVGIYKLAIDQMEANQYGESSEKRYYNPVRLHALVRREETLAINSETGELDQDKNLTIGFLRDDLVDLSYVIEISDIVLWDEGYYQIDNVKSTNYWWGRNPDTDISGVKAETGRSGYAVSIIIEVHRTTIANLNLVETKAGINSLHTKSKLPRNL